MAKQNPLWTPSKLPTNLSRFQTHLESKIGKTFSDYQSFHSYSVSEFETFWMEWLSYSGFILHQNPSKTLEGHKEFSKSKWFPNALYNFAENLLEKGNPNQEAIVFYGEDGTIERYTYHKLKKK